MLKLGMMKGLVHNMVNDNGYGVDVQTLIEILNGFQRLLLAAFIHTRHLLA